MSAKPANIWYISHYAGGPGIGRHNRGWHLCHQWQKLGLSGTVILASDHHMLDGPQQPGSRQVDGVDYAFIRSVAYKGNGLKRFLGMLSFTWSLMRLGQDLVRRHGKPDMVIGSSPHPFTFLASHYLARRYAAKSVLEVRDLWPASVVEIMGVSNWHPGVRMMNWIERFAYARADAVVSLLPKTLAYMKTRGLNEAKWHYIPNGIDVAEEIPPPTACEISRQIEAWQRDGHMVVAYTGAFGVPNRVDSLIGAMAEVRRRGLNVRALLVGRGELEEDLKALVAAQGLVDHVLFFPQISRQKVLGILSGVDVGYISLKPSSVFRFGISPNKIFDYMLASLPIVSVIDAGNDLVAEADCGISVPRGGAEQIAAAFERLADMTPDERRTLGRNGRDFAVRNHDFAHLARRYAALL